MKKVTIIVLTIAIAVFVSKCTDGDFGNLEEKPRNEWEAKQLARKVANDGLCNELEFYDVRKEYMISNCNTSHYGVYDIHVLLKEEHRVDIENSFKNDKMYIKGNYYYVVAKKIYLSKNDASTIVDINYDELMNFPGKIIINELIK